MWKSNKKDAFTIIEVLCGISIFSILLLFAVGLKVNEMKIEKANYETVKCTYFLDSLKKEIALNATKEDIKSLINNKKIYISKAQIEDDDSIIKLNSVFSENAPSNKPYIILSSEEYGEGLKIVLNMYMKFYGEEKVYSCTLEK